MIAPGSAENATRGTVARFSSFEEEWVSAVLDDALALFAERGEPLNGHDDIKLSRKSQVSSVSDGRVEQIAAPDPGLLFGTEFFAIVSQFLEKAWQRDHNTSAGVHVDRRVGQVFPLYSNGDANPEGFVLASVGDLAGRRIWPVVVPADVIRFSLTSFGPAANRVRVLSEVTSLYCDAVRVSG